MIVDDQPELAEAIAEFLRDEGYDAHICTVGALALAAVARHQPDLLILDLLMPAVGGWEILTALRLQPAFAGLPVLLMSSGIKRERREFYRRLPNHTRLIAKPLEYPQLLFAVEMLLHPGLPPPRDARCVWSHGPR
ncbi:MAG: response regulator [Ardenticatenaceae bacterium]|nr:response regulator [Ardenticatenaceae bacterium]